MKEKKDLVIDLLKNVSPYKLSDWSVAQLEGSFLFVDLVTSTQVSLIFTLLYLYCF